MNQKEFDRYLERDGGRCLHCGTTEGLVPQHRKNRGMGGTSLANLPSNVIVLCSAFNGEIESNPEAAAVARENGWKVGGAEQPATTPVYDKMADRWYLLLEDFTRVPVVSPWQWAEEA